jgi:D-xylose transport system ATP-binding protein
MSRSMLLELHGIRKSFGPVDALAGVDFAIDRGEVVGLVGDNGAGKSTLVKVIAGVHKPDAGTIQVEGEEVQLSSPADSSALGIQTVYQDLALCDNLDVVSNLFLGHELVNRVGPPLTRVMSEDAMERFAIDTLADLRVTTLRSTRLLVGTLSGGQRQAIAIARAVLRTASLIVLDEPTAALGVAQAAQVKRLIRELRDRQSAVLLISHNLEDVFDAADRICVLRLGRNAGNFTVPGTTKDDVVRAITSGSTPQ